MGVNIYILDRRRVVLWIGGVSCQAGTLRQFWKVTEMDAEREAELDASSDHTLPSPLAAIVAEAMEMQIESDGPLVKAHLTIGWDEGRSNVTDFGWDYLPVLGYAVRQAEGQFVLHEETGRGLKPIERTRAITLDLISSEGALQPKGQPVITDCQDVKMFIPGFARADCTLASGQKEEILVRLTGEDIPSPQWFVGRTPRDAAIYDHPAAESM